jgi:hypothetical protein
MGLNFNVSYLSSSNCHIIKGDHHVNYKPKNEAFQHQISPLVFKFCVEDRKNDHFSKFDPKLQAPDHNRCEYSHFNLGLGHPTPNYWRVDSQTPILPEIWELIPQTHQRVWESGPKKILNKKNKNPGVVCQMCFKYQIA